MNSSNTIYPITAEMSAAWDRQQIEELRFFKNLTFEEKMQATDELSMLAEEFLERARKRKENKT